MVMITPPAAMPIRRIKWQLVDIHQVNKSQWTGRRQVSENMGVSWYACSAEFVPIVGQTNARRWRGFFAALNGKKNTFPVVAVEGAQHALAEINVTAGAQGNNQISVSANRPLKYGDMMTVKLASGQFQLVALTGDLVGTTATFMPPLRENAATGAGSLETRVPFAIVALVGEAIDWDVDRGQQYGFAFSAEEVIE